MHHSYLDKYSRGESPLHRLEARTKLLVALAGVVMVSAITVPGPFCALTMAAAVFTLCLMARIPLRYLLARSAIIIPFGLFAALTLVLNYQNSGIRWQWSAPVLTVEGLRRGAALLWRSWIAVCFLIILINTTPFDEILKALRRLGVSGLFVLLLSFLYRFLYLLWDERERMQRARDLRYFGGRWGQQIAMVGNLAAALFVRSYECAERVQKAMLARGWDGNTRPGPATRLSRKDWATMAVGWLFLLGLWIGRHH